MSDWNEDTIPDNFGGDGEGDLAYLESYQKIDVDSMKLRITTDATNLVTQLCNMYLKADLISNEAHVRAIAAVEVSHLSSALLAVRSVEHALTTLMRQLDSGGYANPEIFDSIASLSKTSMELTIKSAQYIRSLPEYLKFTATEMQTQGVMESIEILQDDVAVHANNQQSIAEGDDSFAMSGPILGTRALMLQIRDEETNLDAVIEKASIQQKELEADNLRDEDDDVTEFEEIE